MKSQWNFTALHCEWHEAGYLQTHQQSAAMFTIIIATQNTVYRACLGFCLTKETDGELSVKALNI